MLRQLLVTLSFAFLLNFNLFGMACPADFNRDGKVDDNDVKAFEKAFMSGDLSADMDGDGKLSQEDGAIFMTIYRNGCIKKSPIG